MKLGIMQPYFFPYLGYFDLICSTDRWIVFDTVQYIRHGWMNRNRILHPNKEWQYIIVSLKKHSRNAPIYETEVSSTAPWKEKILHQIENTYRNRAPFFDIVFNNIVCNILSSEEKSLSRLNILILDTICSYLQIPFNYQYFSEMKLPVTALSSGDWALEISKVLGAEEYINPPGGRDLFNNQAFQDTGIRLTFLDREPIQYKCPSMHFMPRLSIIDTLMWTPKEEVQQYLGINSDTTS